MLRVRNLLLGLSGAFLLASCGKEETSGLPLAYAPADAPYVMGNREVMSESVMNAWWARTEPLLAGYAPMLESILAKAPAEKNPLAHAVLSEFVKLRTRADYAALGLGGSTHFAIYGVGLIPVMRLELADPAPLKALIARAEAKAGVKAPTATLGAYEYYPIDAEKVELILAIGQGQIVATAWPKGASDAVKSQLLASAPPADSVLGTDNLQTIESQYGLKDYGSGYLDTGKLLDIFLKPSRETDVALLNLLGYKAPEMSADCSSELRQMVAKAPRAVFGISRFDETSMETLSVLELEPALAAELVPIAAQVPDAATGAKWGGFSFGFNSQALIQFLDARAKALAAAPFKCEQMQGLDRELTDAIAQLRQAGGFLGMAKGLAFRLDALDMDLVNKQPTAIDMAVVVASDAPQALVSMASMGLPQLAQLGLEVGGEPKALPLDGAPPQVTSLGSAWAVMTDKALAVRFAKDDQGAGVQSLVKSPLTAPGTLLVYSFSGEIYRLLAQVMRSGMDPSMPAEQGEQMAKLFENYAKLIGRVDNSVVLTARGVEIRQAMTLQ